MTDHRNSLVPRSCPFRDLFQYPDVTSLYPEFGHFPRFQTMMPRMDLTENENMYTMRLDTPGMNRDDIKVELQNGQLVISGVSDKRSEDKSETYVRRERHYGSFKRVETLPEDADQDKIAVRYQNGVLEVSIPRVQGRSSHRQLAIE